METFGTGAFIVDNVDKSAEDMADKISQRTKFIESGKEEQIHQEVISGFDTDKSKNTRKRFFGF